MVGFESLVPSLAAVISFRLWRRPLSPGSHGSFSGSDYLFRQRFRSRLLRFWGLLCSKFSGSPPPIETDEADIAEFHQHRFTIVRQLTCLSRKVPSRFF